MMMEMNQSLYHTWKVTITTVILVPTCTSTSRPIHRKKSIYIIIIVILILVMIRRISDFTIINLVHITRIGIQGMGYGYGA